MGNWSDLHHDLLVPIAQRLNLFEDFFAFGGVCTSWRSAATKDNFNNKSPQNLPWLMLSENDEFGWREFYNLSKGTIRKVMLPEAKGKLCLGSQGWLMIIGDNSEIHLLNPLFPSFNKIKLPVFEDFDDVDTGYFPTFIRKVAISDSPSWTSNYIVMVIYGTYSKLAFWRAGETSWNRIEFRPAAYQSLTYHNARFYALDYQGHVVVCEVGGPNPTEANKVLRLPYKFFVLKQLYVMESAGELLIVVKFGGNLEPVREDVDEESYVPSEWTYKTTKFEVLKVDLKNGKWVEVKSLRDRALFLGHSSSISVEASLFPGCKANCIYFTDDCIECYDEERLGGKDMGIYNLESGCFEPHYKGESYSAIATPMWIQPSF